MSTFSGLNTAASGLAAARRGMDVVGQNIANQKTEGYTRQRVQTSAIAAIAQTGRFSVGAQPGHGVSIELWSLRYLSGAPDSAEASSPMARGELVALRHRFGAQHSQVGRRTSPWRRRGRQPPPSFACEAKLSGAWSR